MLTQFAVQVPVTIVPLTVKTTATTQRLLWLQFHNETTVRVTTLYSKGITITAFDLDGIVGNSHRCLIRVSLLSGCN